MAEIAKATGLSFGKARGVVGQLAREGYVHSRPYAGTVVLSRGGTVRGAGSSPPCPTSTPAASSQSS